MFKNAVISLLAVALFVRTECYAQITGPVLYFLTSAVFFVALAAVEDEIDRIKRRRSVKRKFRQQLEQTGTCRKEA